MVIHYKERFCKGIITVSIFLLGLVFVSHIVPAKSANRTIVYHGDNIQIQQDYAVLAKPVQIPYGTDIEGKLFDGYPQVIKEEGSKPIYDVKAEKDVPIPMRDGVR